MSSKTKTLVLVLSLAINLLVAGGLIGFWLKDKPGPRFPAHLTGTLNNIDPALRQELRQKFKEVRAEGKHLHIAMRRQQRTLEQTIEANPFDEQATRDAFAQTRHAREAIEAHMHNQIIEVMKDLSPDQRVLLLQNLSRRQQHRKGPPNRP